LTSWVDDVGGAVVQDTKITNASLRTPRAAAIAGIVFALLLGTGLLSSRCSSSPGRWRAA
jgi:high-affinity Fe2+/Pb2+ permease